MASVLLLLSGCKYDNDWLTPDVKSMIFFGSALDYERTVIPGEGLQFGIGPALAGVLANKKDWTVDLKILKDLSILPDNRMLLPDNYYNSSELGGNIRVTIPKGKYFDFFYVKLDSAQFLSDANTMTGSSKLYALPVKIVGTSADTINTARDQVLIGVKYQAATEGWYLHETSINSETGTTNEKSFAEADNVCWRMTTRGPFTVRVASPITSTATAGLQFDITVQGTTVVFGAQVDDQPLVEPISGQANSYDPATRDFQLNFQYVNPDDNDRVYKVSTKLTFRNRVVDGINQPRAHLVY